VLPFHVQMRTCFLLTRAHALLILVSLTFGAAAQATRMMDLQSLRSLGVFADRYACI